MKKFALAALAALFIVCLVNVMTAGAQQMSDEHKAQIEKIERFIGEWTAEAAVMEGDGKSMVMDLTLDVIPIVEGWACEFTASGEIAEVGPYSENKRPIGAGGWRA